MQNPTPSLSNEVVGNDMLWAVIGIVHSMRTLLWFVLLSDVHSITAYKWLDSAETLEVWERWTVETIQFLHSLFQEIYLAQAIF